jgi:hypothetical protein
VIGCIYSGLFLVNGELITKFLPSACPSFLKPKNCKSSSLNISNVVLTNPSFFQLWSYYSSSNQKRKKTEGKEQEEELKEGTSEKQEENKTTNKIKTKTNLKEKESDEDIENE